MRLFLLGFMGAGKSYWAKELAEKMDIPRLDLDEEIVQTHGQSIAEIFAAHGEHHFRKIERERLQDIVSIPSFVLACGGGTPCFFDNMDFMNNQGLTIWLNASVEMMAERLKNKKGKRPLIKDLEDEDLHHFVAQKLAQRRPFYEKAQLIIDPADYSTDSLHEKIKSCINLI